MFSLRDIAILEEGRQARGTADVGRESEEIAGGWMTFAGNGSWANQACGLGLQGPVTDEDLDRLVEFYDSRGVEPRIEVCPFADETLIAGLSSRGFRLREFENVLARELRPAKICGDFIRMAGRQIWSWSMLIQPTRPRSERLPKCRHRDSVPRESHWPRSSKRQRQRW